MKRHQIEIIRSDKKLSFYSILKTDVSKSDYLEQVKNLKHRQALAKFRSGNRTLRIESGRHCTPIPLITQKKQCFYLIMLTLLFVKY